MLLHVSSLLQICIGPVCVPLHLFLPFILGVLHQYGFFKWVKKEWVRDRAFAHTPVVHLRYECLWALQVTLVFWRDQVYK